MFQVWDSFLIIFVYLTVNHSLSKTIFPSFLCFFRMFNVRRVIYLNIFSLFKVIRSKDYRKSLTSALFCSFAGSLLS